MKIAFLLMVGLTLVLFIIVGVSFLRTAPRRSTRLIALAIHASGLENWRTTYCQVMRPLLTQRCTLCIEGLDRYRICKDGYRNVSLFRNLYEVEILTASSSWPLRNRTAAERHVGIGEIDGFGEQPHELAMVDSIAPCLVPLGETQPPPLMLPPTEFGPVYVEEDFYGPSIIKSYAVLNITVKVRKMVSRFSVSHRVLLHC